MTACDIAVLHADDALLVLDKPAGLLSVPGRGDDKLDCLARRVQAHYPDALIVHRLDMATSGLLLMARGAECQRRLSMAFERREVAKRYRACVAGKLPGATGWGEIALALASDWPRRPKQKVAEPPEGRPSLTRYRVLGHDPASDTTQLELEPVTGRSHQLRVHLLAIGHPILGDSLYAPLAVQAMAPRLLLHASRLSLAHPLSGTPMRFESDTPF